MLFTLDTVYGSNGLPVCDVFDYIMRKAEEGWIQLPVRRKKHGVCLVQGKSKGKGNPKQLFFLPVAPWIFDCLGFPWTRQTPCFLRWTQFMAAMACLYMTFSFHNQGSRNGLNPIAFGPHTRRIFCLGSSGPFRTREPLLWWLWPLTTRVDENA